MVGDYCFRKFTPIKTNTSWPPLISAHALSNHMTTPQSRDCPIQSHSASPVSPKVAGPRTETGNGSVGVAKWLISQSDLTGNIIIFIVRSSMWLLHAFATKPPFWEVVLSSNNKFSQHSFLKITNKSPQNFLFCSGIHFTHFTPPYDVNQLALVHSPRLWYWGQGCEKVASKGLRKIGDSGEPNFTVHN